MLALVLAAKIAAASPVTFNAPPGDSINLKAGVTDSLPSWTTTDRIVLSPYFYWYDVWSQAHLLNPDHSDALTTHPASLTGFSYKSVQWHKTQLRDMEDAGVDVVLPVYWGDPSQLDTIGPSQWSYAGIPPLVAAREALLAEGKSPPRIGLFYDTTTLERNARNEHIDLTEPRGHAWFYESIRDFFSLVPPTHWALINHSPIIFTWVSSWAKNYDQTHITKAKRRFAEEFGGHPFYLVKEVSWNLAADDTYAWGGAFGLRPLSVASIGPGYDHSNVPGRDPFLINREGGAFFERNWIRLLRSGIDRVMIETWNEYHEGTDISHSLEYGRQYIDLNRHYTDLFKARFVPPPVTGPFSDLLSIGTEFSTNTNTEAIQPVDWPDGPSSSTGTEQTPCRTFDSPPNTVSYLYFRIHDSFRWTGAQDLKLQVIAELSTDASFDVQYDGSDTKAPFMGAYTLTQHSRKTPISARAAAYEFLLPEARFNNAQNGGSDFRLRKLQGNICIHAITLSKVRTSDPETNESAYLTIFLTDQKKILVRVHGQSGTRYVVEDSGDLKNWNGLSSVFIPAGQSSGELIIPAPQSLQYFRLRTEPQ